MPAIKPASMTVQSVTIRDIVTNPTTGSVYVRWTDGTEQEFSSLQQIIEAIEQMSANADLARMTLLAWWIARQPDGSNTNIVIGKTLTLDYSAASPIRVQ